MLFFHFFLAWHSAPLEIFKRRVFNFFFNPSRRKAHNIMTGRGTRGRPRGSTALAIQQQQAAVAAAHQQQMLQQQAAIQQQQMLKQQQQQQQHQQPQYNNIQVPPPQVPQPGDQPVAHNKPTDRNLSLLFDDVLPEAKLYRNLQEVERKIDATLHRKKLDLQDIMARNMRTRETMRIFISNSVNDQPWQVMASGLEEGGPATFDFDASTSNPSFNLRIEGRLVDDKESLDSSKRRSFSSYFTSIIVEFENLSDPTEGTIAEWHEITDIREKQATIAQQQQAKLEFDVLDVRRKGDRPVNAKILLQVKEYPNKFKLSPQLSKVIAIDEETKAGVVFALWQYIKFHRLQDIEDKRLIRCDAALRQVFACDSFTFPQIVGIIQPHLLPRAPIIIDYKIQVDKENNVGSFVYDIEIEKDHPMKEEMAELLGGWNDNHAEIQTLDDQISQTIQAMNANRLKYQFMEAMAKNPVDTITQWLDSQASDLRLIMSDKGFNEEEVRRSDFYTDEVLGQTVHMFLNAKR